MHAIPINYLCKVYKTWVAYEGVMEKFVYVCIMLDQRDDIELKTEIKKERKKVKERERETWRKGEIKRKKKKKLFLKCRRIYFVDKYF